MDLVNVASITTATAAIAWAIWERRRSRRMAIDPIYGIYTRVAVEARPPTEGSIIFWDVDMMRQLNTSRGYEDVDQRISTVVKQLRASRDCTLVARWYSGDEFIYNCPSDSVQAAAERIRTLFSKQGISVTIGIAPIHEGDWREAVRIASHLVQDAKRRGDRGKIYPYHSYTDKRR